MSKRFLFHFNNAYIFDELACCGIVAMSYNSLSWNRLNVVLLPGISITDCLGSCTADPGSRSECKMLD